MPDHTSIYLAAVPSTISEERVHFLLTLVSEETQMRFDKFRFQEDALQTLYGELLLRLGLKQQFGLDNQQLKIAKSVLGKPYLEQLPIHFNISHSGRFVACGISSSNIGVDIEQLKAVDLKLANRFFHPQEYRYLQAKEKSKQGETFFDLWTLKESYLKWKGTGLRTRLDSFQIGFLEEQITVIDQDQDPAPYFHQYSLDGYRLSVCCSQNSFPKQPIAVTLEQFDFTGWNPAR